MGTNVRFHIVKTGRLCYTDSESAGALKTTEGAAKIKVRTPLKEDGMGRK